jgi:hypothetical protein
MPTPVWGGGLWALPINPPPRTTPATKVNAAERHANLALLSLVGSMAYGFAINQSSMQSIEDWWPPYFIKKCGIVP